MLRQHAQQSAAVGAQRCVSMHSSLLSGTQHCVSMHGGLLLWVQSAASACTAVCCYGCTALRQHAQQSALKRRTALRQHAQQPVAIGAQCASACIAVCCYRCTALRQHARRSVVLVDVPHSHSLLSSAH
eukprot:1156263-Pelagomonas_calceolata.AAC.6